MTKRLLILCFAVFMISSAIAQEASRWRGPTADGKYPDTGVMKQWPADGPEMLWSFEDLGQGHSTPVVYNGKIYVSGAVEPTGFIYVFDMNGKLLKKYEYGKEYFEVSIFLL